MSTLGEDEAKDLLSKEFSLAPPNSTKARTSSKSNCTQSTTTHTSNGRNSKDPNKFDFSTSHSVSSKSYSLPNPSPPITFDKRSSLELHHPSPNSNINSTSPPHRQRRRLTHSASPPGQSPESESNQYRGPAALFSPPQAPINSIPHTGTAVYTLTGNEIEEDRDEEEGTRVMEELSDVVGQLSLNENKEVRYHGRSSGLYLISQSGRFQDFFW
jgi:hypothetical protein